MTPDTHYSTLIEKLQPALLNHSGNTLITTFFEESFNEVLQAVVAKHLNSIRYEHAKERNGQRNGVRKRKYQTLSGEISLHVPQV